MMNGREEDDPGQDLGPERGPACLRGDLDARLGQLVEECLPGLRRDRGRELFAVGQISGRAATRLDGDGLHLVGGDVVQELRIVEGDRLLLPGRRQKEEQHNEDCERDQPEVMTPPRRRRGRNRGPFVPRRRGIGLLGHGFHPTSTTGQVLHGTGRPDRRPVEMQDGRQPSLRRASGPSRFTHREFEPLCSGAE